MVIVLILATLEGVARIATPLPPDPELRFCVPRKPAETFRIGIYGGSTAEGVPLPEFGFPRQLEFWLRRLAPGKQLEVLNFARGGMPLNYAAGALERTRDADIDLRIVLSGHNEFVFQPVDPPFDFYYLGQGGPRWSAFLAWCLRSRHQEFLPNQLQSWARDGEPYRAKIKNYEEKLAALTASARQDEHPLLLCVPSSNLSDWSPVFRALDDPAYLQTIEELRGQLARGETQAQREATESACAAFEHDAIFHFLLGQAERQAGNDSQALQCFARAREEDPVPMRAPNAVCEAVRGQAGNAGDPVRVVDLERAFARFSGDFVGYDLVADNVHPTPLGGALIARELLLEMGRQRWFLEGPPELPEPREMERVFRSTFEEEERLALTRTYLLRNALFSLKAPFLNFSASRMYLDQLEELDPKDWRIWSNRGSISLLDGKLEAGLTELERATRLKGAALDPDDRGSHPYLKEALKRSGVSLPVRSASSPRADGSG